MPAKVYKYDPGTGRMAYIGTAKVQPRERVRLPLAENKRMDKSMGELTKERANTAS
jgi:hypothetical protein